MVAATLGPVRAARRSPCGVIRTTSPYPHDASSIDGFGVSPGGAEGADGVGGIVTTAVGLGVLDRLAPGVETPLPVQLERAMMNAAETMDDAVLRTARS